MGHWEEVNGLFERAGPQDKAMYWEGEGEGMPSSVSLCSCAERERSYCVGSVRGQSGMDL